MMPETKERDPQKEMETIERFGLWVAIEKEHVEAVLKYWIRRCMAAEEFTAKTQRKT